MTIITAKDLENDFSSTQLPRGEIDLFEEDFPKGLDLSDCGRRKTVSFLRNSAFFRTNYGLLLKVYKELPKISLIGADLNDLIWANFRFRELDLSEVDFSGGIFKDGTFDRCYLNQTRWNNGELTRTKFLNCNLVNAKFHGCKLIEGTFVGGWFAGVRFEQCSLYKVSFWNCDLSGADFSRSRLSRLSLKDTKVSGDTIWPRGFSPTTEPDPDPNQKATSPVVVSRRKIIRQLGS